MRAFLIGLLLLTTSANAAEWVTRDSDTLLGKAALAAQVNGQTLVFYDNGRAEFLDNGAYSYSYDAGGTAFGRYQIGEDSTICITYENGFSRCDLYVINQDKLVLITEDGVRFPIRP